MLSKISFKKLPLWLGVSNGKQEVVYRPFEISLDKNGLLCQSTQALGSETHYENEAYEWITPPPGASKWANYLGELYYNYIAKHFGPNLQNKVVTEIGAGSSYICNKVSENFQTKCFNIVDPAFRDVVNPQKVKVFKSYWDDQFQMNLNSDYFFTLNVLEHVKNPYEFMNKIHANLSEGGQCIMIFPNTGHQLENGDFNGILHEHINYFTKDSSDLLFAIAGFEVLDFHDHEDTFYYLLKKSRPLKQPSHVNNQWIEDVASKFERNFQFFKNQLDKLLMANKKVAFHGATNGLNNLLGMVPIKDLSIVEVFDGDDLKTGRFISSFPKPIKSVADYGSFRPDFVIISAMTFYQPIKCYLVEKAGFQESQILTIYPN